MNQQPTPGKKQIGSGLIDANLLSNLQMSIIKRNSQSVNNIVAGHNQLSASMFAPTQNNMIKSSPFMNHSALQNLTFTGQNAGNLHLTSSLLNTHNLNK